MSTFKKCRACRGGDLKTILNFGDNPTSVDYKDTVTNTHKMYSLSMGTCLECNTLQLMDHIPEINLINPPDWISYNEPEGHLDAVSDYLYERFKDKQDIKIKGLSYKDKTLLNRLVSKKLIKSGDILFESKNTQSINIEYLQSILDHEYCKNLVKKNGLVDILIVRHVLEHTFRPKQFIDGIRALVSPGGLIIFEIPDCSKQLHNLDYTCLWEEHTFYFVKKTFENFLLNYGLEVEKIYTYEYSIENSLVAICRNSVNKNPIKKIDSDELYYGTSLNRYSKHFSSIKKQIQAFVLKQKQKGTIVLFGAGHLAVTFIHIYELKNLIDFVIDDDPNKIGKYMPGSSIEIKPSLYLNNKNIGTCLLSLSPESEKVVLDMKYEDFKMIGSVYSIFPGKLNSIPIGVN